MLSLCRGKILLKDLDNFNYKISNFFKDLVSYKIINKRLTHLCTLRKMHCFLYGDMLTLVFVFRFASYMYPSSVPESWVTPPRITKASTMFVPDLVIHLARLGELAGSFCMNTCQRNTDSKFNI